MVYKHTICFQFHSGLVSRFSIDFQDLTPEMLTSETFPTYIFFSYFIFLCLATWTHCMLPSRCLNVKFCDIHVKGKLPSCIMLTRKLCHKFSPFRQCEYHVYLNLSKQGFVRPMLAFFCTRPAPSATVQLKRAFARPIEIFQNWIEGIGPVSDQNTKCHNTTKWTKLNWARIGSILADRSTPLWMVEQSK